MLKETEDILMNNITDINRRVSIIESSMAEVRATNINGDEVSPENHDETPQVNGNGVVCENEAGSMKNEFRISYLYLFQKFSFSDRKQQTWFLPDGF